VEKLRRKKQFKKSTLNIRLEQVLLFIKNKCGTDPGNPELVDMEDLIYYLPGAGLSPLLSRFRQESIFKHSLNWGDNWTLSFTNINTSTVRVRESKNSWLRKIHMINCHAGFFPFKASMGFYFETQNTGLKEIKQINTN
jgi:hypothetical protein